MASTDTKGRKTSVTSKFNWMLSLLYAVSILVSLPVTYYLTKQQIFTQANKELTLLVDMVRSVRNVVREDTRPYFLPKGEFFAPVVSSTVMAKTVARKFARLQPDYYIKIASDNPLNLENLPQPLEKALLERFRSSEAPSRIVESGLVRGMRYLVSAAPAVAKEGCMRCHGSPADAPDAITGKYGTKNGYGWNVGQVVGTSVVGVPLGNINELVTRRSAVIIAVVTLVYAIVLIVINRLVHRTIIRPVLNITKAAYAVSHGDLKKIVEVNRNDEIGQLAGSFELMRRSLVLVVRRLQSGKQAQPGRSKT